VHNALIGIPNAGAGSWIDGSHRQKEPHRPWLEDPALGIDQRHPLTLEAEATSKLLTWRGNQLEPRRAQARAAGSRRLRSGPLGFDLAAIETPAKTKAAAERTLMERFGVAPFSVLKAREGWWQERKRAWLALGIQSELGRGENALGFSDTILGVTDRKAVR
jgi:hypothetical protein